VVECILQVLRNDLNAKVLACAPSNEAADLICLRLAEVKSPDWMFRLNAFMRAPQSLEPDVKKYSLHHSGAFQLPKMETLREYQIVVSTCSSSGYLFRFVLYSPPPATNSEKTNI